LVHNWSSRNTQNWHPPFYIRGVITDTTNVDFDIISPAGSDATINWWVVEATTGNFATQPKTIDLADTESSGFATITSIAEDKTFLVGSIAGADDPSDYDANSDNTTDIVLTDDTTITMTRAGSAGAIEWAGHAVTMAGANALVQRGTISDDAAGNPTVDLTTGGYQSAGDDAIVHVAGSMGSHTAGSFAGLSGDGGPDSHCAFTFEDGGDTLRMQRFTNDTDSNTNDISWEVIEWDIGGAPPPTRRVMVIS
jgi:hypothetical protein